MDNLPSALHVHRGCAVSNHNTQWFPPAKTLAYISPFPLALFPMSPRQASATLQMIHFQFHCGITAGKGDPGLLCCCLCMFVSLCVCVCLTRRVFLGATPPLNPPYVKIEVEVFVSWGIPEDSSPPSVLLRGLRDHVCLQGWTEAAALCIAPSLLRLPATLSFYVQKGA